MFVLKTVFKLNVHNNADKAHFYFPSFPRHYQRSMLALKSKENFISFMIVKARIKPRKERYRYLFNIHEV